MGANSSKSEGSSPSHTWESSGPFIKPDHDLSKRLQSSTESDASRSQTIELAIQEQVAAELKKLADQELASLREAREQISQESAKEAAAASASEGDENLSLQGPTRHTVSKEVAALRAKLEERRRLRDVPSSVVEARGEVVRCLRENDRRPLDCWREVEHFKEEVRRMEYGWVDKVIS